MEVEYVDIGRRFRELTEEQTKDPNALDLVSDWEWLGYRSSDSWDDLEKRFRTVVLAEAGSGKTREMQERCKALKKEEKFAFFLPLELIESDDVSRLLESESERDEFQKWVSSSNEPAWLFLDALDELKLRDGIFKRALFNLKAAIRGAEMRARIIVSCRPHDWYLIDNTAFCNVLPPPTIAASHGQGQPATPVGESPQSGEDRFLAPLRGKTGLTANSAENPSLLEAGTGSVSEKLAIYKLLALQETQIEQFIRASQAAESEVLICEIREKDAWDFARIPQDIIELIAIWEEKRNLGTRTEQHEAHIRMRLRDRIDRPAPTRMLSDSRARLGVERLALALALSKKRTIRIPGATDNRTYSGGSLDASALLTDWSPADIKTLLSLGIFDPPTFERIRFHRRCVEDYLAACRLKTMAEEGNASKRDLLQRIFTTTASGDKMVIASMRPIAIWLAQSNQEIRQTLIEVDPVILIGDGDPEVLPVEDRVQILRRTIQDGDYLRASNLSFSSANLRRYGAPEFESVIRKHWKKALASDDLMAFLLSMMRDSSLGVCSDLIEAVVRSDHQAIFKRVMAMQALIAYKAGERVQTIANEIAAEPLVWPSEMLKEILAELFPLFISATNFIKIIEEVCISGSGSAGQFENTISEIAEKIDPESIDAIEIRDGLTRLIVENKSQGSAPYHPRSRFSSVSIALATLLVRQASSVNESNRQLFLRACSAANCFRPDHYYGKTDLQRLHEWIQNTSISREEIFRSELNFICDEFEETKSDGPIVLSSPFIRDFSIEDRTWLLSVVTDAHEKTEIRLSALLELVRLWNSEDRPSSHEKTLRTIAEDHEELTAWLAVWLRPKTSYPEEAKWEKLESERQQKEEKRLCGWREWRNDLIGNPETFFAVDRIEHTRRNFLDWMMADNRSNSSYQVWSNGLGVEQAFGAAIKEYVRTAFAACWRDIKYEPFSEHAENSGTPYSWLYGLNGVLAEADSDGWASELTAGDVRQASLLSLVEINGFPSYLEEIAKYHPSGVSAALGEELHAQLQMADRYQHLPLLQDLTHSSRTIKIILNGPLLDFVCNWKDPDEDAAGKGFIYFHLSQVLRVLVELKSELDLHAIEQACLLNFERNPQSKGAIQWLRALFNIDADVATSAVERSIAKIDDELRSSCVVSWFGGIFDEFRGTSVELRDEQKRIAVLARLCRLSYRYIIPSEDQNRAGGGAYSPNSRDHAQSARSRFLNQLIEIEGEEAHSVIAQLAADPVFDSVSEYLKNRVRVREVQSAEPISMSIDAIHTLEKTFECTPSDRDSIFRLMCNRIEDLQHDIAHHDFFPRKTIQGIEDEEEMQRLLSLLLDKSSRSSYHIVREDQAADRKRTDIRMLARNCEMRAVIEVKVGDRDWTAEDYVRAIDAQLVGFYLRFETCRAGCLLISYRGKRKFWIHPDTKKRLHFEDLMGFLNNHARRIEKEKNGAVRISVIGLDLRDPELAPAHRNSL
jgi:hypothetical protein